MGGFHVTSVRGRNLWVGKSEQGRRWACERGLLTPGPSPGGRGEQVGRALLFANPIPQSDHGLQRLGGDLPVVDLL